MAGSGTTLVVARALGHRSIGFDTDPLAVLLARVWCSDVDAAAVRRAAERARDAASRLACRLPLRLAYPDEADDETRAFVRYWFDETNRRQLAVLAKLIADITRRPLREVLWCAFSRMIITKQAGVSLALDAAHSRPHRVVGKQPVRPLEHFLRTVDSVVAAAPFKMSECEHPPAAVRIADARRLPLDAASVDVVISSPPYLNAIDYLRGHKLSLVWMGRTVGDLRLVRATNIGTEVSAGPNDASGRVLCALDRMGNLDRLPPRQRGWLARYVSDMDAAIGEIARVLVPGGRAVLVIGDPTVRGVYVRNSRGLAHLAECHGLAVARVRRRKLPPNRRYLPPPSSCDSGPRLQNRLRTEVLLELVNT